MAMTLAHTRHRLPGDLAMWFFILAELTVFGIFFIGFAIAEQLYPVMFSAGKSTLHTTSGLINTLALISGSFCVAQALAELKIQRNERSLRWMVSAILCGLVYLVVKSIEYNMLLNQGYDISTNTFYGLYFFITFFHFMHVILGLAIIGFMIRSIRLQGAQPVPLSGQESGACYWHMVDLVWIILFPLVYVI